MDPSIPLFSFDTEWVGVIQFIIAVGLPVLVGIVTTKVTKSWIKVVLLGGLTFVSTILTGLLDANTAGVQFQWLSALLNAGASWAYSIAIHFGIWKPLKVTDRVQESEALVIPLFRAGGAGSTMGGGSGLKNAV